MSKYKNVKVHVSDNQKDKIKKAIEDETPVSIRFTYDHLNGDDILAFTESQLVKMKEAYENNKAITIKMSKTQVQHNKQIEGGFIGSLLTAAASAVAPSVIGWIWDKISGKKEVYAKNGAGIVKIQQMGEGLYLRPYKTDAITGAGLWLKTGKGFEQMKDATIKDIDILNEILK
jgi:hypothetical protein